MLSERLEAALIEVAEDLLQLRSVVTALVLPVSSPSANAQSPAVFVVPTSALIAVDLRRSLVLDASLAFRYAPCSDHPPHPIVPYAYHGDCELE